MQKWPDGTVHYIGTYHENCPDGGVGFDSSIQFVEGQYTSTLEEVEQPKVNVKEIVSSQQ